jgi:hypothetical protein
MQVRLALVVIAILACAAASSNPASADEADTGDGATQKQNDLPGHGQGWESRDDVLRRYTAPVTKDRLDEQKRLAQESDPPVWRITDPKDYSLTPPPFTDDGS